MSCHRDVWTWSADPSPAASASVSARAEAAAEAAAFAAAGLKLRRTSWQLSTRLNTHLRRGDGGDAAVGPPSEGIGLIGRHTGRVM